MGFGHRVYKTLILVLELSKKAADEVWKPLGVDDPILALLRS
jgi:citrate synthase